MDVVRSAPASSHGHRPDFPAGRSSLTAAAAMPATFPSPPLSSSSRGRGYAGSCSATGASTTRSTPRSATSHSPATGRPCSGSLAVAEDCDTVLQGEGSVLVHCRDWREGQELARLTRAKLAKSNPQERHRPGEGTEYQSVAVNCGLVVQGRDNIHLNVTGDDDCQEPEKPHERRGVGDRGTDKPVLADKLYQYCRQVAGLRNGDYFFAVGCKDVFCGNVLNIIKAKEPIVIGGMKRSTPPASPASPRSYNVAIDHVTKSEGLAYGAEEAYGGFNHTRAQFREQGTPRST